jgi:ubiquinone/menaquinone biosynthesis C-methylase UbiE
MKTHTTQSATAKYYSRWGSRLGYLLVMKRSQHFGYYDIDHTDELSAQKKYHQEFAKLLQLEKGMNVLDAGCGQGVVACYLAQHFDVKVTGITITPYEVNVSKRNAMHQKVSDHTSFLLADYAEPPFESATFDRIYTTETLSHAPDVQKVLGEFLRLLKPGGMLVCTEYMMDYKKFNKQTKEAAEFAKDHAAIYGIYQFGKGQFVKSLTSVGFQSITDEDWTEHTKPSFDRLRRLAKPVAKLVEGRTIQKYFVNTVLAKLYADNVETGLFEYRAYTAIKPKINHARSTK